MRGKGVLIIKCCRPFGFVCCYMTQHDERVALIPGGFNQMLLDLCFCMRLQDDTA